jgi:hypothetical protein
MAYENQGEKLLSELGTLACSLPIFSSDGRYAFVALTKRGSPRPAPSLAATREIINVAIGDTIDFAGRNDTSCFLGQGWANPEPDFRWTLGQRAELNFTFSQLSSSDLRCVVRAAALVGPSHPSLAVQIEANGTRIGEWKYESDQILLKTVIIPADLLRNSKHLQIAFLPVGPSTPKELGINDDQRRLGLAFRELTIEEASPTSVSPYLRKVQ